MSADLEKAWGEGATAEYGLERPARCAACKEEIQSVYVVRLYRVKVSFMSSLPRSGHLLVCPLCKGVVSGDLGALL